MFDGLVVLPKRVIKGWRDGRFERCTNKIIRQNGTLEQLRAPRWLGSCEPISDVLVRLQRRDVWPAVEMLVDDGTKTDLYLGPIVDVTAEGFCLKCYDAVGKWEGVYELPYNAIFRVEIDSMYCNQFDAYMKARSNV